MPVSFVYSLIIIIRNAFNSKILKLLLFSRDRVFGVLRTNFFLKILYNNYTGVLINRMYEQSFKWEAIVTVPLFNVNLYFFTIEFKNPFIIKHWFDFREKWFKNVCVTENNQKNQKFGGILCM